MHFKLEELMKEEERGTIGRFLKDTAAKVRYSEWRERERRGERG
jgi:hypothetical protein